MKFTCTKDNLVKALVSTGYVSGKQVNLPILQNVLVSMKQSETKLISTNLEIAVAARIRAKVEEDGEFTVPARMFLDYMNSLPGERVDVEVTDVGMCVQMGKATTVLKGMDASEFPLIPGIESDVVYEISADVLLDGLQKVAFAASKSDVRPELAGVLFHFLGGDTKALVLAATDSFRLAEKRVTLSGGGTNEKRVIVPARTVSELVRIVHVYGKEIEKVVLRVSDHQVVFECEGVQITSRLTDGTYPQYEHIIPKDSGTQMSCLRQDLIDQAKGAGLFTTKGIGAVRLQFSPAHTHVVVMSTNAQTGEHVGEIVAEGEGGDVEMFVNYKYLLDGLQVMQSERLRCAVSASDAPLVFRPSGDETYLYMVMPIKQ